MFGWLWKKKKPQQSGENLAALLDLPDDKFAEAVSGMISISLPAERAMIVVAWYNLVPMVGAVTSAIDEEGSLRQLLMRETEAPDIGNRRWWLCCGYLVRRLDWLVTTSPDLTPHAAQVWASLIEGAQYVPALLKNNVMWPESEKNFVLQSMSRASTLTPTPREAMLLTLKAMMPKRYQSSPEVKRVVAEHDLTYIGA